MSKFDGEEGALSQAPPWPVGMMGPGFYLKIELSPSFPGFRMSSRRRYLNKSVTLMFFFSRIIPVERSRATWARL
jgi:hypothetical protein